MITAENQYLLTRPVLQERTAEGEPALQNAIARNAVYVKRNVICAMIAECAPHANSIVWSAMRVHTLNRYVRIADAVTHARYTAEVAVRAGFLQPYVMIAENAANVSLIAVSALHVLNQSCFAAIADVAPRIVAVTYAGSAAIAKNA